MRFSFLLFLSFWRLRLRGQERGLTGYPETSVCMKVVLRFPVSGPLRQDDFHAMVHMLPTSAAMRILQARLNIQEMDLTQLLMTEEMNNEECDALLRDQRSLIERPFYSHGDAKWARGFSAAIHALDADRMQDKLKIASYWTKMGFSLALTRTAGSDTYKNGRANLLGARMKKMHDLLSDDESECTRFFHEFVTVTQRGRREGCLVQEALIAYIKVLQKVNHDAWTLRPDNLFLLMQLITSDLMLSMNFHGSVVQVCSL